MKKDEILKKLKEAGIERAFGVPISKLLKKDLLEVCDNYYLNIPGHVSPSQIEMFRRCSMQYFYRYIKKMVKPPRAAMTLGSSVDAAVNAYYQTKLEKGAEEPLSVLTDVFMESLREREQETEWNEPLPLIESDGLKLVKEHRETLAPATEPIEIQKELVVEFTDQPFTFLGYADLIASRSGIKQIIDLKVTGSSISEDVAQYHPQLTAYHAAQAATGEAIGVVALDVCVRPKKAKLAQCQTIVGSRNPADDNRYWKTVRVIYDAIKAGIFYPAPRATGNRSNWVCTPQYCGYFQICHEQF